jgi:alkanesulfonate monooxygenase SsuD/methylene tetrahydromethanopterin reductase-like flavin-dependent oxidoreductase (luciferase family)
MLQVGVVLWPTLPWKQAAEVWRRAESYGFAHAWSYDHLSWRGVTPWHDCFASLAAAATITSRIGLGPLVTTPNFRHPIPVAKALITLADISGGRVCAGVGAGGLSSDAGALGDGPWSLRERAERFENWVALLDRALSEPIVTYEGRYYSAHAAAVGGASPRIPLAIAATGPRGMRVVARCADTWIAQDKPSADADGFTMVQRQLAQLETACAEIGRDPRTIRRLLLAGNGDAQPLESRTAFDECAGRYSTLGFTDLVLHWPMQPTAANQAVLEDIAANLPGPSS